MSNIYYPENLNTRDSERVDAFLKYINNKNSTSPPNISIHPYDKDSFGRIRVSDPYTIFDSKQLTDSQPFYWDTTTSGTGTTIVHSSARASSSLNLTTTNNAYAIRQTKKYFNYQPGKSFLIYLTAVMNSPQNGLVQRVGYFDASNGIYFELYENEIKICIRSATSGVVDTTEVYQSNWNIDTMDGSGVSGITLDITKAQIFVIDLEWLGVGSVRLGFVIDGALHYIHKFNHANNIDSVYMSTPNLPIRYEIRNITTTNTNSTLEAICAAVLSEGGYTISKNLVRSVNTGITKIEVNDTYPHKPLIQLKLQSAKNRTIAELLDFDIICTSGNDMLWQLLLNPTMSDLNGFTDASNSSISYKLGGTSSINSAGTVIASGYFATQANGVASVLNQNIELTSNINGLSDLMVLSVQRVSGNQAEDVFASITWREIT
jgi:hypothetical protein